MKNILLKVNIFFAVFFLMLIHCSREKPALLDGNISRTIAVMDTTGLYNTEDSSRMTSVSAAKITMNCKDYEKKYQYVADSNGIAQIDGLIAATYEIFVEEIPVSLGNVLVASKTLRFYESEPVVDTLFTHNLVLSPLVINEIYTCGPPNKVYYFYDQYVELYNRSDETQYLDAMIITRVRPSTEILSFIDIWDYVENTYAFQFPGSPGGTEYPVYPGQYVVIAGDAYDHSQSMPGAVNLENADWECVNQLSSDYDNPNVPNLHNINMAKTIDYLISLTSDAVILAQGSNYWQNDTYVDVHISTILDGVEYKKSSTGRKILTRRLDGGFTGVGISNYTGKSKERVTPGKDSNNSTVDFEVIDAPTPGYSH
jgi:hypothetical protein